MSACTWHDPAAVELYFYGELAPAERVSFEAHLSACRACREALDELAIIRDALAARPDVSAPPAGDWSGFMTRLDRAVRQEVAAQSPVAFLTSPAARPPYVSWVAVAALLALVTITVLFVARTRQDAAIAPDAAPTPAAVSAEDAGLKLGAPDPALAALTEEHFERSKLVVLGLATKDAEASGQDWDYERTLASALLNDTRLYRLAAEDRGLSSLAGVLRDLELVLLETSLTETADPQALGQIQRLIRKRDLLEKMEVVSATGI